jgi:hypothetical protein
MPKTESTHPNAAAFPPIGGPPLRALAQAGIRSLDELSRWSAGDLLELHGMGRKGFGSSSRRLPPRGAGCAPARSERGSGVAAVTQQLSTSEGRMELLSSLVPSLSGRTVVGAMVWTFVIRTAN